MQSGWDDDGDDDDVDGGADFLLFCLFHVSSADEFLLQTGVVRQSVKYLHWHAWLWLYLKSLIILFFKLLVCVLCDFVVHHYFAAEKLR